MDIPQDKLECQAPAFLLMHGWLAWVGWGTEEGIGVQSLWWLGVGRGLGQCVWLVGRLLLQMGVLWLHLQGSDLWHLGWMGKVTMWGIPVRRCSWVTLGMG